MPSSQFAGSVIRRLTLVCPTFADAFAREPQRLPSLERLAAQADAIEKPHAHGALHAWQGELLDALELDGARYASAPVTWLGATGERAEGSWVHADPVFLTPSAQGLQLQPAPPWTPEQLDRVTSLVSEHLSVDGMIWRVAGTRSFIQISGAISARMESLRAAARMSLSDALPTGADAKRLRQAMNDMQMLMHERLGADAPNGVWLWGMGAMPDATPRTMPALWTDDHFARGVYRVHAASDRCFALPHALDDVLAGAAEAHRIVLVDGARLEELENAWFAPAYRALTAGRVREVHVCLDGWRIRTRRSLRRRLFARPRALQEVLQ